MTRRRTPHEVLGVPLGASADEIRAKGIKRGYAAIDVEIALFAGGKREVAGADGFFQQEGFECGGGFKHGQMMKNQVARGKNGSLLAGHFA